MLSNGPWGQQSNKTVGPETPGHPHGSEFTSQDCLHITYYVSERDPHQLLLANKQPDLYTTQSHR